MAIVWVGMARRIQEWHFKGVPVESGCYDHWHHGMLARLYQGDEFVLSPTLSMV